jgi:hypothetical protein
MIIITVEESTFLPAMGRIVGGVEVEHEVRRRLGMRGEELIDQDLGDPDQGLAIDAVLEPAEGRRRGEQDTLLGDHSGGELESRVGAEGLMIVEVLIAEGDGGDPLGEQGFLVMDDDGQPSGVGDGVVEGVEESEPVSDLSEQEGAGVGGEPAALEVGDDALGPDPGKGEGFAVTVCHSGGLAVCGLGVLLTQILQGVRPSRNSITASRMKYPG